MQENEKRWATLPHTFTKPLLLMMGGFGMVQVRHGLIFDPNEPDCTKLGAMYAIAKPELDRGWLACKRGLYAKVQPFADFVSKVEPYENVVDSFEKENGI
jgi:hypothetical protein